MADEPTPVVEPERERLCTLCKANPARIFGDVGAYCLDCCREHQ